MKHFAHFLIFMALCATVIAQKPKAKVELSADALPDQLLEYVNSSSTDKDKLKDNAATIDAFKSFYGQLPSATQQKLTAVFAALTKSKAKSGDISSLITNLNNFYTHASSNFDGWIACVTLLQTKGKNPKRIYDFASFASQLAKDRTICQFQSSLWQAQAGAPFTLECNGQDIIVTFSTKIELYYSSKTDNGTIYGTQGKYYYLDNRWEGEGGRLNWDRAGLPTTTCWATLNKYTAETKFPKFTADSVQFVNTNYFKKPILGRVEELLSNKMEPSKYNYPKFKSYQTDFKIKDILPGIDYEGTFKMNGGKMVTNDEKNPGNYIFYRGGERFIVVSSPKYSNSHSELILERSNIKIYLGKDSICNDGVTVRYRTADKVLNIINDPQRNFYSPYSDSYHCLDIYSGNISWKLDSDKLIFGNLGSKGDESACTFESANYFAERKARKLQGIEDVSPVMRVYSYAKNHGSDMEFYVDDFAQAIHLDLIQAKAMIHNLAGSGLVTYNESEGRVYCKDKLSDYVKAINKNKKHDYDAIVFESNTRGSNAELNLESLDLSLSGVKKFVVSDSQMVAIYPTKGNLKVHKNRDLSFSGRINAGRFVIYVSDAAFSYDKFNIDLPKVDSLFFYVKMFNDPNKERLVRTPLYELVANIQIDEANNHNGLKPTKDFPIFTSKEESRVYYDRPYVQHGAYTRDRFYFKLHPFTVRNLVDFETDSLVLGGSLVSAGIFPEFEEPLKVQQDYSLGFIRETPAGGFPAYGGKGRYTSTIDLSYHGLHGRGQIDYLTSTTKSQTILFLPDSMFAVADTFWVRQEQGFPEIHNGRVINRWLPYKDSMQVAQIKDGTPFSMFNGATQLSGYVAVMPQGAMASGTANINDEGTLASNRFTLTTHEMDAQVSTFQLRSKVYNNIAFAAQNMKSHVDYKNRQADFTSNVPIGKTQLPALQYIAYVDKFSWGMDHQTLDLINSHSEDSQGLEDSELRDRVAHNPMPGALLVSTHPDQDSLKFRATHSVYHYDQVELSCRGVYRIDVADAAIAPSGDSLHISAGAQMRILPKSRILASRETKYHEFYDADVIIASARKYSAKGYIDYVDEEQKHQKIFMESIAPNDTGMTVGNGFIGEDPIFPLNEALAFAGKVRVQSDTNAYFIDGGVRLLHQCYPASQMGLLAYQGFIDSKNVQVKVPEIPTDWQGQRITAGILFDKSNLQPRSAFLTNERGADNELFTSWGLLDYDNNNQVYRIASAEKLKDPTLEGRMLTLNTQTCELTGEGPLSLGIRQGVGSNFAYGTVELDPKDVENTKLNTLFGIYFPMDTKVIEDLGTRIQNDLRLSPTNPDNELLRKAMQHYMGREAGNEAYSSYVATGAFDKMPKEFQQATLLFERIPWQYSTSLGYYFDGVVPLALVGKTQLHYDVRLKAQIATYGKNTNLTLYLQLATDHWYYFNYEATTQQLVIYSSVGEWDDMVKSLSADKRQVSDKTGTFHYRIGVSKSEVPNFLLKFSNGDNNSQPYSSDEEEDE